MPDRNTTMKTFGREIYDRKYKCDRENGISGFCSLITFTGPQLQDKTYDFRFVIFIETFSSLQY